MTLQATPGYTQLVKSIFMAIQAPLAGRISPARAVPSNLPFWNARPFIVDGTRRVAPVVQGRGWRAPQPQPLPNTAALSTEQRRALAAAWLADALDEHAAVAALARFTLQLLSLGAPPELLRAGQRASLDDITHAQLCFGLASAYAGRQLGAGALQTADALPAPSRRSAVLDAIGEGCVGETIHAMTLVAAANRCEDPAVTHVLRRIAADEARHAALAWKFVRWAIQDHDALRAAARDRFEHAIASVPIPRSDRADGRWMAPHGRLPARERAEIAAQCTKLIIAPCAVALLDRAPDPVTDAAALMPS